MKKIFFISGIHGVGKTTFCKTIQKTISIKHYSCSSLIKENSSYIEVSKEVDKENKNQQVLIESLRNIHDEKLLLDGHFCLIDKSGSIFKIEDKVFESLNLSAIILLLCEEKVICDRLKSRDGTTYELELIKKLQKAEKQSAKRLSTKLNIPLIYFKTDSVDLNLNPLLELIQ